MASDRATCRTCRWFRGQSLPGAADANFCGECMFAPASWSGGMSRPPTKADDYCAQHQPEPDPEADNG